MKGDRFLQLQDLFDKQKYFKMICGAGNEDLEEVKRLTMIYTLAGAKGLDISASPKVVESCVKGIDIAFELSTKLGINLKVDQPLFYMTALHTPTVIYTSAMRSIKS